MYFREQLVQATTALRNDFRLAISIMARSLAETDANVATESFAEALNRAGVALQRAQRNLEESIARTVDKDRLKQTHDDMKSSQAYHDRNNKTADLEPSHLANAFQLRALDKKKEGGKHVHKWFQKAADLHHRAAKMMRSQGVEGGAHGAMSHENKRDHYASMAHDERNKHKIPHPEGQFAKKSSVRNASYIHRLDTIHGKKKKPASDHDDADVTKVLKKPVHTDAGTLRAESKKAPKFRYARVVKKKECGDDSAMSDKRGKPRLDEK